MGMLEELDEARLSASTFYNEFLNRFNPKINQIFVFYEGEEDSSYYQKFIERTGFVLEELVSGCKNNVIKNYNDLKRCGYNVEKMYFIVDRDLSFWLNEPDPDPDIFVTDGYSVENYAVCLEIFDKLISQVKGFGKCTKQEKESMCKVFYENLLNYRNAMQQIMACAVIAKKINRDIKLSKLKYRKFLNIKLVHGKICMEVEFPKEILEFWNIDETHFAEIDRYISLFNEQPNNYHVRGKWLLPFMIEIAEIMRLNARCFAPSLNIDTATQTCSIEPTKALGVLGPRCTSIPTRFKEYCEGRCN